MPILHILGEKKLKYTAADERALSTAVGIIGAIAEHDEAAKQDATSAATYLKHVLDHVKRKRKPA